MCRAPAALARVSDAQRREYRSGAAAAAPVPAPRDCEMGSLSRSSSSYPGGFCLAAISLPLPTLPRHTLSIPPRPGRRLGAIISSSPPSQAHLHDSHFLLGLYCYLPLAPPKPLSPGASHTRQVPPAAALCPTASSPPSAFPARFRIFQRCIRPSHPSRDTFPFAGFTHPHPHLAPPRHRPLRAELQQTPALGMGLLAIILTGAA